MSLGWRVRRSAAAAALVAAAAWACSDATRSFVTDPARALGAPEREALTRHHEVLLRDHDIDYRIEIAAGAVGDLLAHGVRRYAELAVGSRSGSGRGLLLVVDPVQDRVRLEVGQNLEGVFPDAFVAYLQERQMVPFFRQERLADGILATTELIVSRAQDAQAQHAFSPPLRDGAAGGGAEARARLGAGDEPKEEALPDVRARESPEETVAAYLDAMASRNANAALDLYTAETRRLLERWVMTPAQMDSLVRTYRSCQPEPVRIDATGTRAVVRYPAQARLCAPWLLVREGERWRLDLASAQRAIRFGAGNAWHFAAGAEPPYAFAFADWRIDARGFPHAQ